MTRVAVARLEPRKTPIQERSNVTVRAIIEATIQVLLTSDGGGLTTTKVAERAGVSIGTLYQYYPNKQALLFAVLEEHLNRVAESVERACEGAQGKSSADVVRDVVEAFVDAKMQRADISMALYRIAAEIDGPVVARRTIARSSMALNKALKRAPDSMSGYDKFAIQMLFGAMAGTTKSVLEAGASAALIRRLREHLVLMCQAYVAAARRQHSACVCD